MTFELTELEVLLLRDRLQGIVPGRNSVHWDVLYGIMDKLERLSDDDDD